MVNGIENMELIAFLRTIVSSELTIALVLFTILDWSTGLISSFILKKTNSKVGFEGILRKIGMYLSIVAVAIGSYVFKMDWLVHMFKMFYIANEVISILENLVECGVELPTSLIELFSKEREKYETAMETKKHETDETTTIK